MRGRRLSIITSVVNYRHSLLRRGAVRALSCASLCLSVSCASLLALSPVPKPGRTGGQSSALSGGVPTGPDWDGHVVWVQPFDNNSSQPGLDWIGASFVDILNQRLTSAGLLAIRRDDQRYALKHLGLPVSLHPTHATTYRLAQTLDADDVVFGEYTVTNSRITASARVLEMHGPSLSSPVEEQGALSGLLDIENSLAWKIAKQINPAMTLDRQTFLAASRDLRLDAFENYIRGLVEPSLEGRIDHLKTAVQLSPKYTQAWLALGKAYFTNQQYDEAEAAFGKVPAGSVLSLEADFYSGLSYLYTGNYPKAQAMFASIAAVLPMPEVLNNQGIAINRRGQDGTAFFQRVVALDPQSADYWFNLAVSERRKKNYAAALKAVAQSIALAPQDAEVQRLQENLRMLQGVPAQAAAQHGSTPTDSNGAGDASKADAGGTASNDSLSNGATSTDATAADTKSSETQNGEDSSADPYEPLERIARSYDEASFQQAAFELERMNALKLHSLPAAVQAKNLCQQGTVYVNDGLLLEAERQFQLAITADPKSAAAYAGLAQVHEYSGNVTLARAEAGSSISIAPNVPAYLVLARLALAQPDMDGAQRAVDSALQLDPKNSAAKGILQAIELRKAKP